MRLRVALRWITPLLLLFAIGCGGGSTRTSGSWKYVALGDSLAVGLIAQQGYVERYAGYARTDNDIPVSVQNLGQTGWQSADLLNALRNDSAMRDAVSGADIVTWNIGGNDLAHAYRLYLNGNCGGQDNQDCFRQAVASFKSNWDGIVAEIRKLDDLSKNIIRTMDIYNPFVAEQMTFGNFDATEPYLDQVNAYIQSSAQLNGIPAAKVHESFNGASGREDPVQKGLIAADLFHANDTGHKIMADLLRAIGYAPKR